MLWYKAWLETRTIFVICLLALTAFPWYAVHSDNQQANSATSFPFHRSVAHGGHQMIGGMLLVAVVFLTAGGLLREQASGAAPFTLSLPFTRAHLMKLRIAVGLMQGVILLVVPSAAIWIEDRIIGKPYPLSQAGFHLALLASGGVVYFAIALLAASVIKGEYIAQLVSLCVVVGTTLVLRDPPAQSWSPFHFMGGSEYFDRATGMLLGPFPWVEAGAWVAFAAVLIGASIKVIEGRDF